MFAPFRLRALLAGIDVSASGSETGVEQGRCCAVIGGMELCKHTMLRSIDGEFGAGAFPKC